MVDLSLVRCECPSVSFIFARLGVFLEKSSGKCPRVGSFLPRDCVAFRPVLLDFYPLIRHSLIVSCMAIWFIDHDGEMITLNEFLFLYRLKPSTHFGYFELSL